MGDFEATASKFYRSRELLDFFTGQITARQPAKDLVVGIAGLMFYIAMISSALNYKEFVRKDEDHIWSAARRSMLGQYAIALRHLELVKNETKDFFVQRAIALLGVNHIDESRKALLSFLQASRKTPTEDELFYNLISFSMIVPISSDILVSIIRDGMEKNILDSTCFFSTCLLIETMPEKEQLVETLEQKADKYPLSCARLRLAVDKANDAVPLLQKPYLTSPKDEIIRLWLLWMIETENPATQIHDDQVISKRWVKEEFPKFKVQLEQLKDPLSKAQVYSLIAPFIRLVAMFDKTVEQEFLYFADQFKKEIKGDEIAERVTRVRWTPKTGPQVKMDFRWSAGEKKADYESKTETA